MPFLFFLPHRPPAQEPDYSSRLLRVAGIGLVLAVLTAGPFFQGLFFWTELLATIVLVSAGFLL